MPLDQHLDAQFRRRISFVEKALLKLDRTTVDQFSDRWISYVDDLKNALDTDPECLSVSTITTSHALAKRVDMVVQNFLDLETLSERLLSALLDESSSTLRVPIIEPSPPAPKYLTPSVPPYLKLSYDWLLKNIHNPYPTVCIRDGIARRSGAARKDIDNWFMDARKRIGWNDARKNHFSNKRIDIVHAATRFYANDEKLSLSQGAEHALISIMKNAKDLYCDKFDETMLATKLASVVRDLTPATQAEAKAERLRQARFEKDRHSYPSPDRSPEPSQASPDPFNDKVDTIATQPISITNRKRRNMSDEPIDSDQTEETRPEKRSRLEVPLSCSESVSYPPGLLSPAPSIDESLQAIEATTIPSPPSPASVLASRKRHLSESDGQVVLKRPRHLPAGPHPHIVSNYLPLYKNNLLFDESSFDGWFQKIFDRPEVGETSLSDFSVELGNLSDFDCKTPTEPRSTLSESSEQLFEPPTLEVADIPSLLDVSWNEFDFGCTDNLSSSSDNPRQSNLVNFVGQEPLPTPLAQDLANFQLPPQASRPANEFECIFGLSNPSIIDPVVISPNPVSNETWDFSQSIVNRDDGNVDFASNSALLASLDFSQGAEFLPSRDGISFPTLPQDKVRQEKEKEFREAYEKAQRLALELQKDDPFAL